MAFKPKPRSEMDDVTDSSSVEQDSEVDIMECGDQRDELQGEVVLSESSTSSSFGDSMCARDDDGDEAQSMLTQDYPLSGCFDDGSVVPKKKVTDEWRKHSQHIRWRCMWAEIKVRELLSQARAYEKEVNSYNESKEFDLEKMKFEGFEGKEIPFRELGPRMNVFRRRRRRRVEETADVDAYMANHNVFSYAEQRTPAATLKPQNLDPGPKATIKEDGTEDDCLVPELDCSDDILAKILCKIDEAQQKARSLRKRVDQLTFESQTAQTPLPQTMQNGEQDAVLEEPLREATVQNGGQHVSAADHAEDVSTPQAHPVDIGGQCLNNSSPGSLRLYPLLEDLLMVEPEVNGDEDVMDDHFWKLMSEITGEPPVSPEQPHAEQDPIPATKRRKTSP